MKHYILANNRQEATNWISSQYEKHQRELKIFYFSEYQYCGDPNILLGINNCTVIILDGFVKHRQALKIFHNVLTASTTPDVRVEANLCIISQLFELVKTEEQQTYFDR